MSKEPGNGNSRVSRRLMLQGAGVAMGLPWLESMPVWGTEISPSNASLNHPQAIRGPVHGLWCEP